MNPSGDDAVDRFQRFVGQSQQGSAQEGSGEAWGWLTLSGILDRGAVSIGDTYGLPVGPSSWWGEVISYEKVGQGNDYRDALIDRYVSRDARTGIEAQNVETMSVTVNEDADRMRQYSNAWLAYHGSKERISWRATVDDMARITTEFSAARSEAIRARYEKNRPMLEARVAARNEAAAIQREANRLANGGFDYNAALARIDAVEGFAENLPVVGAMKGVAEYGFANAAGDFLGLAKGLVNDNVDTLLYVPRALGVVDDFEVFSMTDGERGFYRGVQKGVANMFIDTYNLGLSVTPGGQLAARMGYDLSAERYTFEGSEQGGRLFVDVATVLPLAKIVQGASTVANGARGARLSSQVDNWSDLGVPPQLVNTSDFPVGFSSDAVGSAYQGMRSGGGHAMRHLVDEGLIPNVGSLSSRAERFERLTSPILESPVASFDWKLGATQSRAFAGQASGKPVVVFVAKEGPYQGRVLSAIVPDANQMAQWGIGN